MHVKDLTQGRAVIRSLLHEINSNSMDTCVYTVLIKNPKQQDSRFISLSLKAAASKAEWIRFQFALLISK